MLRHKDGTVEPTDKQKRAFQGIVINKKSAYTAMIEAGYSKETARNPLANLKSSDGFRQLCKSIGMDETLILSALKYDIEGKHLKRVQELTLGADILGMRHSSNVNAIQINLGEDRDKYA